MKQQIDLMTGQTAAFTDQLPAQARTEAHRLTAGVLAAAAFCIGSTLSPGVAAPRAASVTLTTVEVPAYIPTQRGQRGITRSGVQPQNLPRR